MHRILAIATKVANPLALSGLIVGVFFLVLRQIISSGIIPQVSREAGGTVVLRIINGFLILSLVSVVLGFVGYLVALFLGKRYPLLDPDYVSIGTGQDLSLSEIVRKVASKRNVTINFASNCDASILNATIEPGSHEGKNIKEFLENLKQRVKGQSVNYSVEEQGAKRYEIICK